MFVWRKQPLSALSVKSGFVLVVLHAVRARAAPGVAADVHPSVMGNYERHLQRCDALKIIIIICEL